MVGPMIKENTNNKYSRLTTRIAVVALGWNIISTLQQAKEESSKAAFAKEGEESVVQASWPSSTSSTQAFSEESSVQAPRILTWDCLRPLSLCRSLRSCAVKGFSPFHFVEFCRKSSSTFHVVTRCVIRPCHSLRNSSSFHFVTRCAVLYLLQSSTTFHLVTLQEKSVHLSLSPAVKSSPTFHFVTLCVLQEKSVSLTA